MTTNPFFRQDLLSVDTLTQESAWMVFEKAIEMKLLVERHGGDDRLRGKIMAALFYEPSSRTMASFITAMQRLGGGIIPISAMKEHSSVVKGETIEDTARVFSSYADLLVVRHPEVGAPVQLADAADVPVINAGDGSGEHPTQALLDAYTLSTHYSTFSDVRVGLIGDLLYGRTVHSLAKLLVQLGVRQFVFVSPPTLRMPPGIVNELKRGGAKVEEVTDLAAVIGQLDVIYMTRVQKERFADPAQYEELKDVYVLSGALLSFARPRAVVMHPLPRIGEILREVDKDPRAIYFSEEVRNGLYVRMALLDLILRK